MKDGNKFTIKAKGNRKKNVYISSAKRNGKRIPRTLSDISNVVNGGDLTYPMESKPAMERGGKLKDKTYSVSTTEDLDEPQSDLFGFKKGCMVKQLFAYEPI